MLLKVPRQRHDQGAAWTPHTAFRDTSFPARRPGKHRVPQLRVLRGDRLPTGAPPGSATVHACTCPHPVPEPCRKQRRTAARLQPEPVDVKGGVAHCHPSDSYEALRALVVRGGGQLQGPCADRAAVVRRRPEQFPRRAGAAAPDGATNRSYRTKVRASVSGEEQRIRAA